MKTAMQELIDKIEDNCGDIPEHIKKEALEKEKEQIVNAFENGIAEAVNEQHGKLDYNLDGKEYYEQKHNK